MYTVHWAPWNLLDLSTPFIPTHSACAIFLSSAALPESSPYAVAIVVLFCRALRGGSDVGDGTESVRV